MLNEIIVWFNFGLRYSFAYPGKALIFFSFAWRPFLMDYFLDGLLLPSWIGEPTRQRQFLLFSKENWPLMETQEEIRERKRRRDSIQKGIGEQSCER